MQKSLGKIVLLSEQSIQIRIFFSYRKFSGSGFARHTVYPAKLAELRADLTADGISTGDSFYTAGYDGPHVRDFERHNEVWINKQ